MEPAARLNVGSDTPSRNVGVHASVDPSLAAVPRLNRKVTGCEAVVLFDSTIVVDQPPPSATCGMICTSANAGAAPPAGNKPTGAPRT